MPPRFRPLLIAVGLLLFLGVFYVTYAAINTLGQLDVLESERDQWQHPEEILAALNVQKGDLVADLGSGAGYLTLKLSTAVGSSGQVVAIDLRRLSLTFLWARARIRGLSNIRNVIADPDNPHLPERLDAILICNTYHEFRDPVATLQYVYRSLVPGGRLVVADRGPGGGAAEHAVSSALVQAALKRAGFTIDRVTDPLLTDPQGEPWLLLVARKL